MVSSARGFPLPRFGFRRAAKPTRTTEEESRSAEGARGRERGNRFVCLFVRMFREFRARCNCSSFVPPSVRTFCRTRDRESVRDPREVGVHRKSVCGFRARNPSASRSNYFVVSFSNAGGRAGSLNEQFKSAHLSCTYGVFCRRFFALFTFIIIIMPRIDSPPHPPPSPHPPRPPPSR